MVRPRNIFCMKSPVFGTGTEGFNKLCRGGDDESRQLLDAPPPPPERSMESARSFNHDGQTKGRWPGGGIRSFSFACRYRWQRNRHGGGRDDSEPCWLAMPKQPRGRGEAGKRPMGRGIVRQLASTASTAGRCILRGKEDQRAPETISAEPAQDICAQAQKITTPEREPKKGPTKASEVFMSFETWPSLLLNFEG